MKDTLKGLFYLAVVVLCGFLLVKCAAWRWNECRDVGHGVAYCVVEQGR